MNRCIGWRMVALLSLLLFVACSKETDDPSVTPPDKPEVTDKKAIPLYISIPIENLSQLRTVGDPGDKDLWSMPKKAYVYVVAYANDADVANSTNPITFTHAFDLSTDPQKWVYSGYEAEENKLKDIYTYVGSPLNILFPQSTALARIYIALSDSEIPVNGDAPKTEEEIRTLTFNLNTGLTDEQQNTFLKNLYSTPYELKNDKDEYYGTFHHEDFSKVDPKIEMVCYHVAAKLDLTWMVEEAFQSRVKLTFLQAVDINYTQNCSLFEPTNKGNTSLGGPASITYMNYTNSYDGVDTQWYGRMSRYFIQNNNRTVFNIRVGKNWGTYPSAETVGDGTITCSFKMADYNLAFNPTFTPWIRMNITVKHNINDFDLSTP